MVDTWLRMGIYGYYMVNRWLMIGIYVWKPPCIEVFHWLIVISNDMGVSTIGGTPIAGWFRMENPIKMDDF